MILPHWKKATLWALLFSVRDHLFAVIGILSSLCISESAFSKRILMDLHYSLLIIDSLSHVCTVTSFHNFAVAFSTWCTHRTAFYCRTVVFSLSRLSSHLNVTSLASLILFTVKYHYFWFVLDDKVKTLNNLWHCLNVVFFSWIYSIYFQPQNVHDGYRW